jgi:hypothetical protein
MGRDSHVDGGLRSECPTCGRVVESVIQVYTS